MLACLSSDFISRLISDFWSQPLLKDTITTTILSAIGKAAGFVIPVVVALWFGVSEETDAFFYAYGLILLVTGMFAPVVENVIVPFIVEIKAKDESQVPAFLGTTLIFASAGLAFFGICFVWVSKLLLHLFTHFTPTSIDLIFWLLVETIPFLVFCAGTSLLSGTLNAYKMFWVPAFSPALRGAATVCTILILKERLGIHSVAVGYVIGELFRLLVLLSAVGRIGILSVPIFINSRANLLEFLKGAIYQVISMVAVGLSQIVDKTMASWLGPGSISVLEFANRLYQIPVILMTGGLFVVLLSHWSDSYRGDKEAFRRSVMTVAKVVGLGALLLAVMLFSMRHSLAKLIYGYGSFSEQFLGPIGGVWGIYLLGLTPTMFGLVFVSAHLVQKNIRFLMLNGISNCALTMLMNAILIKPFGIYGIALSAAITQTISAIVLVLFFYKLEHFQASHSSE